MNFASPFSGARTRSPPLSASAFHLLCMTVAFVVAMHAPHIPFWLSAAFVLVLAIRWWQREHWPGRVPGLLRLLPTLLLPLVVMATWGTLLGRAPGSALAVGLLVLKLLESETRRDARSGVTFSCFALMSALLFDRGMTTTALVALGLVPALATLQALEQAAPGKARDQLAPAGFALLLAAPLALAAFVFVPRLASPLWGAPGNDQAHTGLSPRMAPGSMTELLVDDRPAMRVSFDGLPPAPAARYFRGYVLEHFDGRAWNRLRVRGGPAPVRVASTIHYEVQLEPNGQHVLPTLDVPLSHPENSWLIHGRQVFQRQPVMKPMVYQLSSATDYLLQPELPQQARQRNLQLPTGYNPRTRKLGATLQQHLPSDSAVVEAVLDRFRSDGYVYTLAPPPLARNSVDDFLFSTRAGYCEHYASAFTFLMRAAGIPARVVTGFQGGYWNETGDYLLVRKSNAHAWSEVWLAGEGWLRVDPTAVVRPARILPGATASSDAAAISWMDQWSNRWDLANRWWRQAVLGFNAARQRGLLTPFGIDQASAWTMAAALAGCIALFALIALLLATGGRNKGDALGRAQRKLERKLARHGINRRPNEGASTYFHRAAVALPHHAGQLADLSARYLGMRYGKLPVTAERVETYRRMVREMNRQAVVK